MSAETVCERDNAEMGERESERKKTVERGRAGGRGENEREKESVCACACVLVCM